MGLTDPCSSYSSVLLNAAVVSENSSSSRSCACRIPLSSAASSAGCRFAFGRWRKRSIALSSSATWVAVAVPSGRGRRWPSLGRIFFWSFALGIPVVAVGAGVALLIASNQLDAAVQTYRNAVPCPSTPTSSACYTTVPGTLVKFSISRGKSGDTADMTLQLPGGTKTTWAKTSWQQEDVLHVGAPLQAKFYRGAIDRKS